MATTAHVTTHHVKGFGYCEFTDEQLRTVMAEHGHKTLSELSDHYVHRTTVTIPLDASLFDAMAMLADIEA